jgi:polyisoprenoid-binding protein YceI
MASVAGHDLAIEVTRWSGELAVGDDLAPSGLQVRIDMGSLAVREGTGGAKPLNDKDRRDIVSTARKTLGVDSHPEAAFTASTFERADGGWLVSGTFALHGQQRPLQMRVTDAGEDRYRFTASVVQSEYGIKPYTGFFGALKVRDEVQVEGEVDLSEKSGT